MINSDRVISFDYGDDIETFFYIPYLQIFDHSHDAENKKAFPNHLHIAIGIFYWFIDIRIGKETTLTEDEEAEYYQKKMDNL